MGRAKSLSGAGGMPPAQMRLRGFTSPHDKPLRCTEKHDVPWSERCLMDVGHSGDHVDKAGREWK